jgi:hypothetical protein
MYNRRMTPDDYAIVQVAVEKGMICRNQVGPRDHQERTVLAGGTDMNVLILKHFKNIYIPL